MYLLCSFANSCRCAVLTAACATSTSMPPSSRRLRAVRRAPSGGTLVWALTVVTSHELFSLSSLLPTKSMQKNLEKNLKTDSERLVAPVAPSQ